MWSRLSSVLCAIVVCFGFLVAPGYAQWVFEDDGCRTPDRGVGNCIPLKQCTPMLDVLKTLKRPISPTSIQKLQAYTCGPDGTSIKVCCPPGPIIIEQMKPIQNRATDPPDVSNHRNLYLLPTDCGYLDSENKIVNGQDADLNEFPWMALLQYRADKGYRFNCGGTIINKNYILTAAHCISGTRSQLVSVRVGEHSIKNQTDCQTINRKLVCNPPVQDLRIEEVIPHPQFGASTFSNDIGLLRVSTINLGAANARPVCLPLGNDRTKTYNTVIVTGWGVSNTETGETSDILQKVGLPVSDKTSCSKTYQGHSINLDQKQICAGGVQRKDSCPGDSGGPMMVPSIDEDYNTKYIQQGIISFGPKYCGIPGYPGVYTLVSYYMDWILDNMRP